MHRVDEDVVFRGHDDGRDEDCEGVAFGDPAIPEVPRRPEANLLAICRPPSHSLSASQKEARRMDVLRSYVIRLYRQELEEIAGMVESVETGETTPFRSPDELWSALQRDASRRRSSSINPLEENGT